MTYRGIFRRLVALAGLGALGAIAACAPTYPPQQTTAAAPAPSGIVTPWSWNVQTPLAAQPQTMAPTAQAAPRAPVASGPLANDAVLPATSMPVESIALSPAQKTELDEARIALGILDRMANRCLTEADAASCTTLQVNWPNLSRQLRQSLAVISGQDFADPIVPQTGNSFPVTSPQMGNVPRRPSATPP
ncbi:hypothetical protein [Thalassospira mesophila]|uniref:Uncharacterized protein n=1 Tax=Thalassospira mesophila TaxID=1293891 RepID=A0A1Y2KWH6_9PROT|nr:hypothetical protein [Thalassospira mesophila]OSQ36541.1 hypothetical protein TMES_17260 [Thalassospira mesophila]